MFPKLREYLTGLRESAFLQVKDGYVDSGAAPGKDTRWQDVAVLKAPLTTKEQVLSSSKAHKKVLGLPIPGTTAPVRTLAETERPPKPSHRRASAANLTPDSVKSDPGRKAPKDDATPMVPIKQ